MTRRGAWSLGLAFLPGLCLAGRFATEVVDASGLGSSPLYSDPTAALGPPADWTRDDFAGGPLRRVAASIVYAAWNTDPDGRRVVVTIPTGGSLTLAFDPPLRDDPRNWHGMDFIVYGNAFFMGAQAAWDTDMDVVRLNASGAVFAEPVTVSVSPDGLTWFTYASPQADALWPRQAFEWAGGDWGEPMDSGKPVPPSLTASSVGGRTVAEAIRMYRGSGGGTAFDLTPSGFAEARYVRFASNGGEIDAVARVGPVGDATGDGAVDIDDYLRLAAAFETSASDPAFDIRSDFNDDDRVDVDDYLLMAANYEG